MNHLESTKTVVGTTVTSSAGTATLTIDTLGCDYASVDVVVAISATAGHTAASILNVLTLSQGDTTTAFASALAAFYAQVPVGHVEAGLRTDNIWSPFPEEVNRRLATPMVALHFAPTEAARENLLRDGVDGRGILVTGNTVVSSVNRGAADLSFGGAAVRFSAGFPALSPMMSLTHGVHGLGDTVAVSVKCDSVVVDVDDYLRRLADALGLQP